MVYIDGLIGCVRARNLDCINVSIIIHTNDIILLAPSITALEVLLQVRENQLSFLDTKMSAPTTIRSRSGLHSMRFLSLNNQQ